MCVCVVSLCSRTDLLLFNFIFSRELNQVQDRVQIEATETATATATYKKLIRDNTPRKLHFLITYS